MRVQQAGVVGLGEALASAFGGAAQRNSTHCSPSGWAGLSRPDRLELEPAGSEGVEETVRDMVARESGCCSFFTFSPGSRHIRELLEAGRHRHGRPVAGLQDRAVAKLAEVDAKIADLTTIRTALAAAVEAGCDDLAVCASSACRPSPSPTSSRRTAILAGPCC